MGKGNINRRQALGGWPCDETGRVVRCEAAGCRSEGKKAHQEASFCAPCWQHFLLLTATHALAGPLNRYALLSRQAECCLGGKRARAAGQCNLALPALFDLAPPLLPLPSSFSPATATPKIKSRVLWGCHTQAARLAWPFFWQGSAGASIAFLLLQQ